MRRRDEETKMTGKSKTVFRHLILCTTAFALVTGFAAAPARAQDATAATQAQPQNQAPSDQQLSEGQLDQLVAPIALRHRF
jgi:DNA-nicking Smr family endonuclease